MDAPEQVKNMGGGKKGRKSQEIPGKMMMEGVHNKNKRVMKNMQRTPPDSISMFRPTTCTTDKDYLSTLFLYIIYIYICKCICWRPHTCGSLAQAESAE